MKMRLAGAVAAILLMAAGSARADMREGALTVSPFVGGYTFDGVERLETLPVYGLRIGYDFTRNFGIDATFDYVASKNTDNNSPPGPQVPQDGSKDISVYNYRLEGIYNFMPDSRFVPFLSVGAGGSTITNMRTTVSGRDKTINNDATAQLGIGFKYFLSENVALRGDSRVIGSFHAKPAFEISRHDYWLNYEYTMGVQFLIGGRKPAVVKQERVAPPPPPPPAPAPAPKPVEPAPPVTPPPPPVKPVPTDCKVSSWSEWSSCTNCFQTRSRTILSEAANGGMACPADLKETRSCSGPGDEERITLLIRWKYDKPEKKNVKLETSYLQQNSVLKDVEAQLDVIGEFLRKNAETKVEFIGWTDAKGTVTYNRKLAQRRADAVKKYLTDKFQIDEGRIAASGKGISTRYDNRTEKGRARNRRTEMIPLTFNKCPN